MKRILLSLCFAWSLLTTATWGSTDAGQLANMLPNSCLFVAEFVQKRQLPALPTPLKSDGLLFFNCHQGLIWQTLNPIDEAVIYTSQKRYFRSDGKTFEHLNGPVHDHLAKLLLSLMGADTKVLLQQFAVATDEQQGSLTLTPLDSGLQRALTEIQLISTTSGQTIHIANKNKQTTEIQLLNIKNLSEKDEKQFKQTCLKAVGRPQACSLLAAPPATESAEGA